MLPRPGVTYVHRVRTRLAMTAACARLHGPVPRHALGTRRGPSGTGTPETAPAARPAGVTLGKVAATSPVELHPRSDHHGAVPRGRGAELRDPVRRGHHQLLGARITGRRSGPSRRLRTLRHCRSPDRRCHERSERGRGQHGATPSRRGSRWRPGLSIGLNNSAGAMLCWGAGVAGDQVAAATFDPAASTDFPGGNLQTSKRVNISAVLEPDVDGDQYGDLTQDLCPQSRLTQAACPAPDTTVTKQPKRRRPTARPRSGSPRRSPARRSPAPSTARPPSPAPRRSRRGSRSASTPWSSPPRAPSGSSTRRPRMVKFKVTKPKR